MKKIISIVLLLAVAALCLCACGGTGAEDALKPGKEETESLQALAALTPADPRTISGSETADGFYEMVAVENGKLIQYTDYATATSAPLCNRPECKHNDETCTAFLSNETALFAGIFLWNNKLIVTCSNPYGQAPAALWLYNADGSGAEKIYTFADGEAIMDPIIGDGEALYFVSETAETQGEECTYRRAVMRLEPETKTLNTMFNIEADETLAGAGGGNFFVRRITRDEQVIFYSITPNGSRTEVMRRSYATQTFYFGKSGVFAVDPALSTLQIYSYADGTVQEVPICSENEFLPEFFIPYDLHDNMLIISAFSQDGGTYQLGIDITDGQVYKVNLFRLDPYGNRTYPLYIVAQAGDKYLVETGDVQDYKKFCRALISVEDYWAGNENYEYITLINSK